MIKLFRNIRKSLVSEGKTTNYLKYAIGEIILVVIGILIALQINNWNEQRKNKHIEYEFLVDLKSDLEETKKDFLMDISANKIFLKSTINIQQHILKNLPFHDSLVMDFDLMKLQTTIYEKSSAFESLKSSGINTITNNEIKKKITDFYNLSLVRAQNFRITFDDLFMSYLEEHFDVNLDSTLLKYFPDFVIKNRGYVVEGNLPGLVPLDYSVLKNDPKFRVIIHNAINQRRLIILRYNTSVQSIDLLIKLIDNELKTMEK